MMKDACNSLQGARSEEERLKACLALLEKLPKQSAWARHRRRVLEKALELLRIKRSAHLRGARAAFADPAPCAKPARLTSACVFWEGWQHAGHFARGARTTFRPCCLRQPARLTCDCVLCALQDATDGPGSSRACQRVVPAGIVMPTLHGPSAPSPLENSNTHSYSYIVYLQLAGNYNSMSFLEHR